MRLQFTKQAREEFLRIVSVFAEYAGPRSADKFIKRVNDRGETLLKHPEVGHPEMLLADRQYTITRAILTLLKKLLNSLKIIGKTFGFLDIFLYLRNV